MAEQYSIQAETLMKSAVEDYEEVIKLVQASNANMALIKAVKITLNGKPRRLVDVGDLRTGESENKLQVLVFNKDHIESLLEAINEAGFETEVDDQFINIDVPDPSYKQLMEVVEDLQRKKNSALGKLTKSKSEATTRARAAVENEFIEQGVASQASKKCDIHYDTYSEVINEVTTKKIKEILGEEFYKKFEEEQEMYG
jgi:ribosome recycling factor